ncbi:DNA primase [Nitrospira sp.]|nr:DNA primase [Nitrospira sp.]
MSRGLISETLLNQIKERLEIVDLVSGHVTLSRTGQNFKARCPFHDERTPSFTVSPAKQLFHCFGCGVSGDAVTFFMKVSGLTFPDAIRELGRRVGVEVPDTRDAEGSREGQERRRLEDVNEAAREHFTNVLKETVSGKPARDYLATRGIEPQTAERFHLGYAVTEWERLVRALSAKGFTPAEMTRAGLAAPRNSGAGHATTAGHYDQFRGRVMFPIRDLRRRVIGFGGRIIGEGEPKYLNSRDTPLFKKGHALYALDLAYESASRLDQLIIVEGYFDVIALHQAGIFNVVATLGTALTQEHIRVIRRYVNRVALLFDPDAAGVRAALRTLDLFVDTGLSVSVVSLPAGDDPDTFVRNRGPEAFRALQEEAPSLWDFALEQSLRQANMERLEDKIRCADAVLTIINKMSHPIERGERLRMVGERLHLKESHLKQRSEVLKTPGTGKNKVGVRPSVAASIKPENPVERELIHLLLQGHLTTADADRLRADAFAVPIHRVIVEVALRHRGTDGRIMLGPTLDELVHDPAAGALVTELSLLDRMDEDVRASVRGCFETLERRWREAELADVIRQLKQASQAGRTEEVHVLNARVNALRIEKAAGRT